MTLFDLVQEKGFKKQNKNTLEGPCPKCKSAWRMIIWVHLDIFKCQNCDFKGDAFKWLREAEGYSCREAHVTLGKKCETTSCSYYAKCSGDTTPRRRKPGSVTPPALKSEWSPRPAEEPEDLWQKKARELVDWAHEQLLGNAGMLSYLEGRGLPLEAAVSYRLGWNPGQESKGKVGPLFKKRSAWGLEDKVSGDKTTTVLAIQRGLIIPSFCGDAVYRIRIRRTDEELAVYDGPDDQKPAKDLFLEGSGKGLVVRNPRAQAFIVVESDLDDLLIDYVAGDLVCSLALTSCGIRPDADSAPVLSQAVCILNALDYDPRANKQTGDYESPGGQNARWWQKHFPNSERWPPPVGKDPGEAWKQGTDLRQWIADGLPISLQPRQNNTKKPEVERVGPFNSVRASQHITDTTSRISSTYEAAAWSWLEKNQPKAVEFIRVKEAEIDRAFQAEDEAGLLKVLGILERSYVRAYILYAKRPPVIDVKGAGL